MIGALLASVVLVATSLPGDARPPASFGVGYGDRASALWMFPPEVPGAGREFVFTEVYQGANNAGPAARAVVGLGVCIDQEYRGAASEVCRGAGFGHDLVSGEFRASPLLDLAQLDYDDAGGPAHAAGRQQVEWRAVDATPEPAPHSGIGASGAAIDVSTSRTVTADGSILGRRVDGSVLRAARVARTVGGGGAVSASELGGYRIERTPTGEAHYRITLHRIGPRQPPSLR